MIAKPKARKPVTRKTATVRRIGNDETSPELSARIESTPPGGLSDDIIDEAFWLSDDSNIAPPSDAGPPPDKKPKAKKYAVKNLSAEEWPWVQALDRFDRLGDAGPLGQLLKNCKPSPRIEKYIEDFIRRRLARGRGRGKTPDYRLSDNDALLMIAAENVRAYVQRGRLSVKAALARVEKEWAWVPINQSTLAAVYNSNHNALNEHRERI
jgi:hypothetical protein